MFFTVLFGSVERGYVCIAKRVARKGAFEEKFFQWPDELQGIVNYIDESIMTHDMWFCPMTFDKPQRAKECVLDCPSVWSDLDTCPPASLLIEATTLIESSPGRYQGLWMTDELLDPDVAEDLSKRIAYYHAEEGADKSGWDITQLLRIPLTLNFKYQPPATVQIIKAGDGVTEEQLAALYPEVDEDAGLMWPYPEEIESSDTLLEMYRNDLDIGIWPLLKVKPEGDWSKTLWNLEMLLCESGLSREDVFSIAREAACNKYRRDGRSERLLWREVCKAWAKVKERSEIIQDISVFKNPDLMSDENLAAAQADRTFIEDYIDWARGVGDAAIDYHQAGGFTCLSGLLAGSIQLPTSFGPMIPNLWFLLLADTTLTRKSTALDLAVDLLVDVNPDVIMATDGSIEGLFGALASRTGRPSIFLRDEFSGLVEMMTKREYYAGMAETLTKMYDGKYQKRQLRKETIEVKDPVLIVFAGGIKSKLLQLLTSEHVSSGFLPRFIFITAKSNLANLKPLGPPSKSTLEGRDTILETLRRLSDMYARPVEVHVGDTINISTRRISKVELTPAAWELYNEMEMKLLQSGIQSTVQELLTPTMDRLAKSGLKASMLIAASRMKDRILVDEGDIYKAFSYVSKWREYAMEVIAGVGMSASERQIGLIYQAIRRTPGIMRSQLMQAYHLNKREADLILDTLEQRGVVNRIKSGRSERLTAVA
jgi:hypothetical protein